MADLRKHRTAQEAPVIGSPTILAQQKLIRVGLDMDDLISESGTDEERAQIKSARIYLALAVEALGGDKSTVYNAIQAFADRCAEKLAQPEPKPIKFREWL